MSNKDFKVKNGIQPTVYHEAVGTVVSGSVGYSLSATSYDSVSLDVSAQENNPTGVFFKDDGTKLYIVGLGGDEVNEYTLSTAWDITTASANHAFSVSGQDTSPRGLTFSPDGTKMYICGDTGNDINQYTLSTAWTLSTASYTRVFSVSGQTTVPRGIHFKTDGTKMFVSGSQNTLEYALSTAWDISTASYTQAGADVSPSYNAGLFFTSDGLTMYKGVWFGVPTSIYKYTLSTAWDLSSAVLSESGDVQNEAGTTPLGVYLKPDGTKMWVVGNSTDTIYQYSTVLTTAELDLSTGSVFDYTPTSDVQVTLTNPAASGTVSQATLLLDGVANGYDLSGAAYDSVSFSVNSQNTNPLDIAFNTDGTKMYVMGNINDTVLQYSLSTGFDLSTASYDNVSFATTSQDTNPRKLSFNNDGTKMYIFGTITDTVYQYSLSTAFDLSTTSYDSVSFNAASQSTNPYGLAFNSDGTKMYLGGGSVFYQYSLSTAFDLSTTSYDSVSFNVNGQDSTAPDLTFSNDGTKMYVMGQDNDSVYQYSLSTAFDLSTASYDSVSFNVNSQDAVPTALAFSNDGTKMYILGNINDTIYQYSTGSAYTVTYDSTIQFGGGTAPTAPATGETDVITFNTTDGGTTYNAALAIDGAK